MASLFTTTELETFLRLSPGEIGAPLGYMLHDSARAYLESEVGVATTESVDAVVTYNPRWSDCWIDLPVPTTAVSAVQVDGSALDADDYQFLDSFRLYRRAGWGGWSHREFGVLPGALIEDDYVSVDVTMTYGFATPPAEFKTWGLILAAQAYQLMPSLNRQSVRIDDYAETFATGGDLVSVGIGLPPQVLNRLKARYGRGASVVSAR